MHPTRPLLFLALVGAMACSGTKASDDTATDAADTDTDTDADTDTDTDTDTDVPVGCGADVPVLETLSVEGSFDGTDVSVILLAEAHDDDGGLHDVGIRFWFDEVVDGVVDTNAAPLESLATTGEAACSVTDVNLTFSVGMVSGLGAPVEVALQIVDVDGDASNILIGSACLPFDDGTPCVGDTGTETGADTGATAATADTGTSTVTTADTSDTGAPPTFAVDVLPMLQAACAPCHVGGGNSGGFALVDYASVTAPSNDVPGMPRIDATGADPANSYLYLKLTNAHQAAGGAGGFMPPSGMLPSGDIDLVEQWIVAGAPP